MTFPGDSFAYAYASVFSAHLVAREMKKKKKKTNVIKYEFIRLFLTGFIIVTSIVTRGRTKSWRGDRCLSRHHTQKKKKINKYNFPPFFFF